MQSDLMLHEFQCNIDKFLYKQYVRREIQQVGKLLKTLISLMQIRRFNSETFKRSKEYRKSFYVIMYLIDLDFGNIDHN